MSRRGLIEQSLLLAHHLPPKGLGGETEVSIPMDLRVQLILYKFADTRTAYQDLPAERKDRIKDYALKHSQHHSRRVANPGHPMLEEKKFLPESHPFGTHKLVQIHEASGRAVSPLSPYR